MSGDSSWANSHNVQFILYRVDPTPGMHTYTASANSLNSCATDHCNDEMDQYHEMGRIQCSVEYVAV